MHALRITPITPLELTMREVLDCMDDFACGFAYKSVPGVFEIISIEPPEPLPSSKEVA